MLRHEMKKMVEQEQQQQASDIALALRFAHTQDNPEPLGQDSYTLHHCLIENDR